MERHCGQRASCSYGVRQGSDTRKLVPHRSCMMKQIVTTAQSVYVDVPEAVRLALRLSSAIKRLTMLKLQPVASGLAASSFSLRRLHRGAQLNPVRIDIHRLRFKHHAWRPDSTPSSMAHSWASVCGAHTLPCITKTHTHTPTHTPTHTLTLALKTQHFTVNSHTY